MRLPLNTLPAFRAVAELQNLRAAAERLHLTHSAVSQQIKGLEEQLGFPLFERSGRGIVLNTAGAALLCAVQGALTQLDEGVLAASAAAAGDEQRLRVSVLPSFAQRWLLPRMARWRARHPSLALEIDSSQQVVDLLRDGFHAALRFGRGPWAGVESEPLFDTPLPLIVLASPETAAALPDRTPQTLARQPLLGDREIWQHWFNAAGLRTAITPVASFNDAGMMLQAAEQGLGITLGRELLAADALCAGRLVQVSPVSVHYEQAQTYHLVYRPSLRDWAPLVALKQWLREELEMSRRNLAIPDPGPDERSQTK
ncbi:LysR family transcriptional regulator [Achromobacter denitrificans]|jgi:LysR family glycine cleavage system transcriptional activator|uniref:LysR family transcriptional regulator n=1 Tax=Achromobacter denitrificans TaxID=32002 RepID=A0A3R9H526_ACHDE|nr:MULTISPECIES: LysR substrate-binding domain-containing protein [Achromobacter]ASC66282.1 LysR family transcriptional regulator [Achromobacter denitrificans]MBV2160280.1 LysR family transcriptional regulator [Achromobacter denitrificans]MDF3848036.1 LysR substrate-binding domain-containing protein [Achromobacter denitrificans]MDF3858989.1 LysR substrate-binding domain-containing protein [Achromobacter denitrificans]MDX3881033.1 LysR substrate-binding domain-containing protein [Achromobacter 